MYVVHYNHIIISKRKTCSFTGSILHLTVQSRLLDRLWRYRSASSSFDLAPKYNPIENHRSELQTIQIFTARYKCDKQNIAKFIT